MNRRKRIRDAILKALRDQYEAGDEDMGHYAYCEDDRGEPVPAVDGNLNVTRMVMEIEKALDK